MVQQYWWICASESSGENDVRHNKWIRWYLRLKFPKTARVNRRNLIKSSRLYNFRTVSKCSPDDHWRWYGWLMTPCLKKIFIKMQRRDFDCWSMITITKNLNFMKFAYSGKKSTFCFIFNRSISAWYSIDVHDGKQLHCSRNILAKLFSVPIIECWSNSCCSANR